MRSIKEKNREFNLIYKKGDESYRNYASHCGLSVSSFWVLYVLYETDEVYMQNKIAETICLPKQTVNSAIPGLIKKGYIELEHIEATRNSKAVKLTKGGKNICKKIVMPLIEAEENSFANMSENEVDTMLKLLNKWHNNFKNELEELYKKSNKKNIKTNRRNK